ncbi:hypothetical protein COU19_01440 [Candidatus Kaiserbacteria bacterium CG10_big_fil_rev_8_21_14_0_10_56_12]|uniref:Uncharacterized protein n=1 Tax=Candidatus Kaiserbacteria bacterium CG10_big_fil_rev_8_21_14_0_10_56_12 TaxID=1974611 RepID=A0A2H0UC47_9BACT|nr:MAG: hypothetical protein COU19_01440 [Candidatus Kaiserbacteria bacterium CG10_big_fil_rev_8_21_14_0_10_56_12]
MTLAHKKALVFVLAGVTYLAGQYFRGVWFLHLSIGTCKNSVDDWGVFCNSPYVGTLGWPLIDLGAMMLVVAIVLLLANAETFHRWLKFTLYYVPIVVLLDLLIYPMSSGIGFIMSGPPLGYEKGIYPFGKLFVLITIGIVLWGWIRAHRAKA